MDQLSSLLHGFEVLLTWHNMLLMLVGILLGIFVGVLPGLGGPNGVAILLPLTFGMEPTSAIVLLSCIYWGALFGGAITAILFNIPGEAWSVATTFDGYPMAQKGQAGEALTAAFTASFFGSIVAVVVITFLAPLVAGFAIRFGPPEFFAVYLLTFCSFIGLGREDKHKIVIALTIGFLLTQVGMDTVSGQLRMTFGSTEMLRGFDFLVAVIGLFGVGEILLTMEESFSFRGQQAKINPRVVFETWKKMPKYYMTLFRSSAIGVWLGITPGGAIAASFMGYSIAKQVARDKTGFGQGRIDGVLAPETAAHAAGTSALLPMLALGIPGSGTAAVLLGGLMVWGLQPGPLLFVEQKDFVWGLIASMYLGNIVGLIIVLATVPLFAAVLRVPFATIAPMILVSCAVGAYAVQNATFDIWLMLLFGILGYVFKKLNYPLAPLVLALVLGDKAEDAFRQAMIGARGSMWVFYSNPLVGTITTLGILLLVLPLLSDTFAKIKARRAGTHDIVPPPVSEA
ncbi:tripartite tricarboxylate transporter permease [Terrihabitans rhizophilus]|jgi:TctA family transporter|uniref:Tripartite tricarboxylate transporter permease n=1 Tax=Terrihabitans rhizophilus TaxID=3092662 RepID=A0ABU4RQT8_9HYPH|nr:tripartite tricarboxylate transporter permease [Terrihabitans sp. PJ23]MDX6807222.1 tripartite tricarboxylate transporter permease [Terrihabitans sp. PJ23]